MPKAKLAFAWCLFLGSSIAWPVLALVGSSEPPVVLHLSIFAVWLTALDGVWVTQEQESDDD